MGLKLTQPASPVAGVLDVPINTRALRVRDGVEVKAIHVIRSATTSQIAGGSGGFLVNLQDNELYFIYNGWLPAGAFKPTATVNCDDLVAAEHERTRTAAIAAVEAI